MPKHQLNYSQKLQGARNAVAALEKKVSAPGGSRYAGLLAGAKKNLERLERVQ